MRPGMKSAIPIIATARLILDGAEQSFAASDGALTPSPSCKWRPQTMDDRGCLCEHLRHADALASPGVDARLRLPGCGWITYHPRATARSRGAGALRGRGFGYQALGGCATQSLHESRKHRRLRTNGPSRAPEPSIAPQAPLGDRDLSCDRAAGAAWVMRQRHRSR
jgi:hypothetical protein